MADARGAIYHRIVIKIDLCIKLLRLSWGGEISHRYGAVCSRFCSAYLKRIRESVEVTAPVALVEKIKLFDEYHSNLGADTGSECIV